ncbi:hypothetical protein EN981_23945, partial [Mesorhizobium sp. M7A.F.Ca.CA.001.13.2.1]
MPGLLGAAKIRGSPQHSGLFFDAAIKSQRFETSSPTKGKHPHMARNKIALIGSGMIGGTLAH